MYSAGQSSSVRAAPALLGKLAQVIQQQQQLQETPAEKDDPTANELEAMLTELLSVYREPAFQAELAALRQECFTNNSNLLLAMGPVVLKVQGPILQKYGQSPNAQGVDRMKHAVQRRVAEGASHLEKMANEARQLLGLELMPNRSATAEEVLASRLDETNDRFASSSEGRLRQLCRERVESDRDSGALGAASAEHLLELLSTETAAAPVVLSLLKMGRYGIQERMLKGLDLPVAIPVLQRPTQEEFFRFHVLPNTPAVLQGTVDPERFPPLQHFPDLTYLRQRCGHRRVLVKSLAHEDRQGRPVFVTDPELKLRLAAFLDHVEGGGKVPFYLGKVPLKRELPELAQEIADARECPQKLYGKSFGNLVPEGVFTYFGCGRNTTAVHFDGSENLLLCLSGTKRLWLFPPSAARHLYPCNDFTRSAVVPFADWEDLSTDLQQKFRLLKEVQHFEVNLIAGDLLYLPSCWWHCVEGSEEPNMILNWWFGLHKEKKEIAHLGS